MPGPDRQFALTIDFVEAATGGRKRIALSPDEWLDVTIPPGIEQDQVLRLKGKGGAGFWRRPAGRCADRGACRAAPVVPPRGRRYPSRAAGQPRRGGARSARAGPDRHRSGHDDDPEGLGHRHEAAAARQGHSPQRSRRRRPVRDAEGRDRRQRRPRTGGISRRAGRRRTRSTRAATCEAAAGSAAQGTAQGTAA